MNFVLSDFRFSSIFQTFLVGERASSADFALFSVLAPLFEFYFLEKQLKSDYPNVLRWFNTILGQNQKRFANFSFCQSRAKLGSVTRTMSTEKSKNSTKIMQVNLKEQASRQKQKVKYQEQSIIYKIRLTMIGTKATSDDWLLVCMRIAFYSINLFVRDCRQWW